MKNLTSLFVFFLCVKSILAQDDKVVKSVVLDSVVIEAVRTGLDVRSFIQLQKNDTTLLNAFKMLRKGNYDMYSRMVIFDKNKNESIERNRISKHICDDQKRGVVLNEDKIKGNLLDKRGRYKFYTAALFDRAFYPELKNTKISNELKNKDENRRESDYDKLKNLVFSPGGAIDIPFIGKRLAIFDEGMSDYYDYSINREYLKDSIPCFVFRCKAKTDRKGNVYDKPVVHHFETWFRQGSYEVLKRRTSYVYHGLLADLDISIDIDLAVSEDKAIPEVITYSGYWNIPGRKAEIVWFRLAIKDYTQCQE